LPRSDNYLRKVGEGKGRRVACGQKIREGAQRKKDETISTK
jgi:hypothetical protein